MRDISYNDFLAMIDDGNPAQLLTPDVSIPLKIQPLLPTVIQHSVAGLLYYP